MTSFLAISFPLGAIDPERAEMACFDCGALSVTLTDERDDAVLEPLPGEIRLWPATRLQALFEASRDSQALLAELAAALSLAPRDIEVQTIADRAWEREWLRDFHAMRFGRRLWICPHHESVSDPDAIVVRLDPGLAFGTGTHATTALCLEWLDETVRSGDRIIDFGCGSGILAIAAVKLGAKSATCFDIDPQALVATRDNAMANDVADRVSVLDDARALPEGVDILAANILSGPLCELAPRFAELVRPGGRVILSGILVEEEREVARAYDAWFDIGSHARRENWASLMGVRRS